MNAPIPAKDLAKVEALLAQGDFETAALLGEAFLTRSEARAQAAFRRGGAQPLAPAAGGAKESVAARARLLRRRRWKVTVSEDGTDLQTEPPHAGGAA